MADISGNANGHTPSAGQHAGEGGRPSLRHGIEELAALRRGFSYHAQRISAGRRPSKQGTGAEGAIPATSKKAGEEDYGEEEVVVKLLPKIRFGFAIPQFSILSAQMLITIHITLLYEYLGTPLASIAFGTALARSVDVLSDPLMGWITDSFRSKYGRRRPFMFFGSFIWFFALFMLLGGGIVLPNTRSTGTCEGNFTEGDVFNDTSLDGTEGTQISLYFTFMYMFFFLADTFSNVPYNALGPELTENYLEQQRLYFTQNLFGMIGTLFGAVSPPMIEFAGLSKELAFMITAIFFGTIYWGGIMNLIRVTVERAESQKQTSVPLVPAFIRGFSNRAFVILLASWVIDAVGWFALAGLLPLYLRYVVRPSTVPITIDGEEQFFNDELWLGAAFMLFFISAILGTPLWALLASRIGKYRAWLAYNAMQGATNALFFFVGEGDVWIALGVTVFNGIPIGGKFLSDSTLADTIDLEEFYSGERREAVATMFASFVPKIVSIPAQALPLAIVASVGFIASRAECGEDGDVKTVSQPQNGDVRAVIIFFYVALPVIMNIISFFVKLKYPIKTAAQHKLVSAGIGLHSRGLAARDPLAGHLVASPNGLTAKEVNDGILLDHFFIGEKKRLLTEPDGAFIVRHCVLRVAGYATLSFACFLTVYFTFHLLGDEDAQDVSWIPSFAQILLGVFLLSAIFNYLRLGAAKRYVKSPLHRKFIRMWILRGGPNAIKAEDARVEPGEEDDGDGSLEDPIDTDPRKVVQALTELDDEPPVQARGESSRRSGYGLTNSEKRASMIRVIETSRMRDAIPDIDSLLGLDDQTPPPAQDGSIANLKF